MNLLKSCLKLLIRLYQIIISPFLRPCCLFDISCSNYALETLNKKGIVKGVGWIVLRLLACQPYIKLSWFDSVKKP